MRLHELTDAQLAKWRKARMESGREKYHHIDHKRGLMVDIVEEDMDIINILERYVNHNGLEKGSIKERHHLITVAAWTIIKDAQKIDSVEEDVDDSEGGHRIWWSEQAKEEAAERADICKTCKDNDVCDLMRALDKDKKCLHLKKRSLLKEGLESLRKYFKMEEMKIGG